MIKRSSILFEQAISFTQEEIFSMNTIIEDFSNDPLIYETLKQSQIIKLIVYILNKPTYQRSTYQINFLTRSTMENKFFAELRKEVLGIELLEKCCRRMHYQFWPTNSFIFREGQILSHHFFYNSGEKGNLFYIILSGRVSIIKTIANNNRLEEQELVQLTDGDAFGELALLKDQSRSASVKTLQNCHFAILSKDDFNVIMKNIQNKKNNLYFEEFASMNLFKTLSFKHIKTLYDRVKCQKLGMNHYIYKEGDKVKGVYLVKKGEFKVLKSIKTNKIDLNENFYGDLEQMINFYTKEPESEKKKSIQDMIEEQIQKKKYGNTHYMQKEKTITIKTIGAEQMFGELDLFARNRERQETVVSTMEENEVYIIGRNDFLESLLIHKELNQLFKNLAFQKNSYQVKQVENYQKNFNDLTNKKQELTHHLNLNFLQIDKESEHYYLNGQTQSQSRSNEKLRMSNLNRSTQYNLPLKTENNIQAPNLQRNQRFTFYNPFEKNVDSSEKKKSRNQYFLSSSLINALDKHIKQHIETEKPKIRNLTTIPHKLVKNQYMFQTRKNQGLSKASIIHRSLQFVDTSSSLLTIKKVNTRILEKAYLKKLP